MIWRTNYPNVHVRTFRKRWSFIWQCFFSAFSLWADGQSQDEFNDSFQAILNQSTIPSRNAILIAGDFNTDNGTARSGWPFVVCSFGMGNSKNNSIGMLYFVTYDNLVFANSWFRHKTTQIFFSIQFWKIIQGNWSLFGLLAF